MPGIDFKTIAGTKLYLSTAKPTVAEGAGAAAAFALLTFVEFGQLTSIGSIEGLEWTTASMLTVGDRQKREKKSSFSLPNADWEFAWVPADPGQIIGKAASKDDTILSLKLVDQDLGINYLTCQISNFTRDGGGADDALKGKMTILRQTQTVIA
jgi:hypothetical protein